MTDARAIVRIETPWRAFGAVFSEAGLAELRWTAGTAAAADLPAASRQWAEALRAELTAYAAGEAVRFSPPLDLRAGTVFQREVWTALAAVPWGELTSYGELAVAAGHPRAARAVGGAVGRNPLPLVVPCHRVLAAGRRLGGWSGRPGMKKELLVREGHALRAGVVVPAD